MHESRGIRDPWHDSASGVAVVLAPRNPGAEITFREREKERPSRAPYRTLRRRRRATPLTCDAPTPPSPSSSRGCPHPHGRCRIEARKVRRTESEEEERSWRVTRLIATFHKSFAVWQRTTQILLLLESERPFGIHLASETAPFKDAVRRSAARRFSSEQTMKTNRPFVMVSLRMRSGTRNNAALKVANICDISLLPNIMPQRP